MVRAGALRQHDVVGLHVAVDDAVLVRLSEGAADLAKDRVGARRVHRAAPFEGAREALALDELHDEEELPLRRGAEVVDLDRVRVLELGDRRHLALEAGLNGGIARELFVERLDGDLACLGAELLLPFVDGAHPPFAEQLHDAKLTPEDLAEERIGAGDRRRRAGGAAVLAEAFCAVDGLVTGRAFHEFGGRESHK